MAWTSFVSMSRHLGMTLRAKPPKTAFLKFRQYKRMMHEGNTPPSTTEKVPSLAEMQEKIMAVIQPMGQNVTNFAKSNADVGAVIVLVPISVLGSYLLWKKGSGGEERKNNLTEAPVSGALPMVPAMSSLMNKESAELTNMDGNKNMVPVPCGQTPTEPEMIPCISCAVPCGADLDVAEGKRFDTAALTAVGAALLTSNKTGETATNSISIQQKSEDMGLVIPVTVSQETVQQPIAATTMENATVIVQDTEVHEKVKVEDAESRAEKPQNIGGRRRRLRNGKEVADE